MATRASKKNTNQRPERAADNLVGPVTEADPPAYRYPDLRPRKFTGVIFEVDAESEAAVARLPYHIAHGPHGFGPLIKRLKKGEYISGPELADMLAVNTGLPLPPVIRLYLTAFLRGEVKVQRGRKGRTDQDEDLLSWAFEDLGRHQARLRKRAEAQAKRKLTRREAEMRDRYGPKGTPYERTIRILRRVYFPHIETEGAVKTLLSAYGERHFPKKRSNIED